MLKRKLFLALFCLTVFWLTALEIRGQEKTSLPDTSVVGIKLGERTSAKAFLEGYQARIGEDGRPTFYFYNKFANQVLKLTGVSFDDRYLLTEIEVYRVGENYRAGHFQAPKIGYFKTNNSIFIGYKQSVASAIIGIPNVDGKDRTGPKDVIKKLGSPTEQTKSAELETLIYKLPELELADETGKRTKYAYAAQYDFNDGKLKRFVLKIAPNQ